MRAQGLRHYYQVLRERIWVVVACVVVCVAAAVAYIELATPKYRATAQLLVSPAAPGDPTLFSLPVLHSSSDPTADVLTASSLVTTPQVAAAVISSLHLDETPTAVLASVTATPVGQSNLVSVTATSTSARQAQAIANEFVLQVIATRTAALHAAIARILPGVKAQVAALTPAERVAVAGTLGTQLSELQQLEYSNDPTITLASSASLPAAPYSPDKKLALAAGLLAGLIIGVGAAFAMDALDPRLRRAEQIRQAFRLPILARIPRERSRAQGRPMLPGEMSFGGLEGYRTLRTVLTSRAAGEPRSFLVTGSSPAEGKTTSAINLAAALAQGGAQVMLIEADLRRPTVASTLGLSPKYGTEHVITGEVGLSEALMGSTFEGSTVQILAVRRGGVELANRLSFAVSEQLISSAKELAEFVVIDSPPLTQVIDALPLAQLADDVLIVARLGATRIGKLTELHDLLLEQGTAATGLVLVGESPHRRGMYYYGDPSMDRGRGFTGSDLPHAAPLRHSEPLRANPEERSGDRVGTVRTRPD